MGFCNSCNHQPIGGYCRCGVGYPPMRAAAVDCPPMPPIPPCGTRKVNGVSEPYWHSIHPLIPKFRSLIALDVPDAKLKIELDVAAKYCNTCQFRSNIHDAICLRAAAQIELQQEVALWQSQRAAAIGYGAKAAIERPDLYSGYYGSLFKDLIDSNPVAVGIYV